MLPVKYRIKKELLPLVLKQNKVFSSDYLSLRVHNRSKLGVNWGKPARLAVIIPNKVSPLSSSRHLIKRQIHAILEAIWSKIEVNLDIIVQVKTSPLGLEFKELEKEIIKLLKTAKVLK